MTRKSSDDKSALLFPNEKRLVTYGPSRALLNAAPRALRPLRTHQEIYCRSKALRALAATAERLPDKGELPTGLGEYRPPHPKGMKGGCSPQNTLRIEQSFRRCKQIFANFLARAEDGKPAPHDGPIRKSTDNRFARPSSRLFVRPRGKFFPNHAVAANFSISVTTRSSSLIKACSPCLRNAVTKER